MDNLPSCLFVIFSEEWKEQHPLPEPYFWADEDKDNYASLRNRTTDKPVMFIHPPSVLSSNGLWVVRKIFLIGPDFLPSGIMLTAPSREGWESITHEAYMKLLYEGAL